jgi:hypothetical protein
MTSLIREVRIRLACRRLQKLVARQKREAEQYRKRRSAAKAGWARRRGLA